MHLCPKLGRPIVIDTDHTRVCLSCKFPVYKLAIKSHKYFRLSMLFHFVPLAVMLTSMWAFQTDPFITLLVVLPWNAATALFSNLLIHLKSAEFYKTIMMEQRNWTNRKL